MLLDVLTHRMQVRNWRDVEIGANPADAFTFWGHIWGHIPKPEQHSPFHFNHLAPQFNSARLHHLLHIPGPCAE